MKTSESLLSIGKFTCELSKTGKRSGDKYDL